MSTICLSVLLASAEKKNRKTNYFGMKFKIIAQYEGSKSEIALINASFSNYSYST